MGYVESLRELVGNKPVILVRPSIIIINPSGELLLVQHEDGTWGVPGGLMELGESVEECARREVKEELGITIKTLHLMGVFSGKELYTKLRNGHEYYNVIIGYICTDYEGVIQPDGVEVLDAKFHHPLQLPERIDPFIKTKIKENIGIISNFFKNKVKETRNRS
ncbi:NUDIX hydrolase [Paenibacillus sp. FSL R5-0345]|uniref:NUDIX hydrolase n=1 Tax=Paenibacillus sp. FSL R5-0345 TaxID=1536770 RepID=UPI0005A5F6EC|nr:NUDIX domain-containing protein [Paenibacillus sp. FSL R5-0345]